jgi:phosphohistidine phosphatase
MKKLFLLRHAHTEKNAKDDFHRILTNEGKDKCKIVANILQEHISDIDMIFSSSAIRTEQTVQNILMHSKDPKINIEYERELYNSSSEKLFQFLHDVFTDYKSILLVNHNPSISILGNSLATNSIDSNDHSDLTQGFSPGSLALYHSDINSWSELQPYNSKLISFWR